MERNSSLGETVIALLFGTVMGFCPLIMLKLAPTDGTIINAGKSLSAFIMLPGFAVGLVVARGRLDDISLWVAAVANFIIYFSVLRCILRWRKRRKTKLGSS